MNEFKGRTEVVTGAASGFVSTGINTTRTGRATAGHAARCLSPV